jgi:hypothetical protein
MVLQLEERIRLKEALDVVMEVQQNLLPTEMPRAKGRDIAGESIYCDETGGDFYDFHESLEVGFKTPYLGSAKAENQKGSMILGGLSCIFLKRDKGCGR